MRASSRYLRLCKVGNFVIEDDVNDIGMNVVNHSAISKVRFLDIIGLRYITTCNNIYN